MLRLGINKLQIQFGYSNVLRNVIYKLISNNSNVLYVMNLMWESRK